MAELKFYIPEELNLSNSTEEIIRLLLNQAKDANLLQAIERVQRYHNFVEMSVLQEYQCRFKDLPIRWTQGCTYLVTEEEPIIVVNIYGAKLRSRWSDLVDKFNEYGKVVNYYEVKDKYEGHSIKTGVRSIWLKDVTKEPTNLAQGDRKLYIMYNKGIMKELFDIPNDKHCDKASDKNYELLSESSYDKSSESSSYSKKQETSSEKIYGRTNEKGYEMTNGRIYGEKAYNRLIKKQSEKQDEKRSDKSNQRCSEGRGQEKRYDNSKDDYFEDYAERRDYEREYDHHKEMRAAEKMISQNSNMSSKTSDLCNRVAEKLISHTAKNNKAPADAGERALEKQHSNSSDVVKYNEENTEGVLRRIKMYEQAHPTITDVPSWYTEDQDLQEAHDKLMKHWKKENVKKGPSREAQWIARVILDTGDSGEKL